MSRKFRLRKPDRLKLAKELGGYPRRQHPGEDPANRGIRRMIQVLSFFYNAACVILTLTLFVLAAAG